jgi:hypothetical protein
MLGRFFFAFRNGEALARTHYSFFFLSPSLRGRELSVVINGKNQLMIVRLESLAQCERWLLVGGVARDGCLW